MVNKFQANLNCYETFKKVKIQTSQFYLTFTGLVLLVEPNIGFKGGKKIL